MTFMNTVAFSDITSDAVPRGLISDSNLVADLVEFLRAHGGQVHAALAADFLLDAASEFPPHVAALIVADFIAGDARLRLTADHYLELIAHDAETRSLREAEFVVVDVETTGATTPACRITEIGAYRIRRGEIVAEFASLVNPQTRIPPFIASLTGITNEMVRDAPPFAALAGDWLRFIEDAVLVAHNAPFDIRFLNCEIARLYPQRRMANAHLCTVALSRRVMPELASHRLDNVAAYFDISIANRHRATGDALATAHVFLNLLDILDRHDVRLLAEARKFKRR